ncbi:MAG: UDP-glucose/GDP-mannose dehydrogenase family protein [Dethiobacter sp.]|jgi:UDPglucose 6-dehydrogenase|nr:UDP-glucose/GDP-mannose dehydrogenase family protein [Dethiobacter sp.]
MKPKDALHIIVIGSGYVGLTTGLALSYLGHRVTCVDKNPEIISKLRQWQSPIYETGLEELLKEQSGRIEFADSINSRITEADIAIVAVGTPSKENGDTDLSYVEEAARSIGASMAPDQFLLVVNKSTVPIGTARRVKTVLTEELTKRGVCCHFSVASNPEFLREGAALHDTFFPDRIVVGADEIESVNLLRQMYAPILEQTFIPPKKVVRAERYGFPPLVITSPTSAELIKYTANAYLAMKISFINEFAGIAERVGADIREVARGIGLDNRIGPHFLNAGVGWGGSCFPKDVRSIIYTGAQYGYDMPLVKAALDVNTRQRKTVIEKLQATLKVIRGRTIGVLGLAFKANTDDIRESPAIDVIAGLLEMGARVKVYDPVAMDNYRRFYSRPEVIFVGSVVQAAAEADALVLLTDWDEFRHVDWKETASSMKGNVFIDGRNLLPKDEMTRFGFTYLGIGC